MKEKRFICLLLALVMCLSIMPITAMAEPPEDAPPQYVSSIWLSRTKAYSVKGKQVYLRSDRLNVNLTYDEFKFDQAETEYDIMLVDANSGFENGIEFYVTPNQKAGAFSGKYTDGISDNPISSIVEKEYSNKAIGMMGAQFWGAVTKPRPTMASSVTRSFVAGIKDDDGVYTNKNTYTFNFYRKATLSKFEVAYKDGAEILKLTADTTANSPPNTPPATGEFDPYETNFKVENVEPGTEELVITAPAYSQQDDTTLKFDDGSGEFIAGTSNTAFTLELENYKEEYKQADGSLIIPFVLDYDQSKGSGMDGHYTLKVSFTEAANDSAVSPATANFDKYTGSSGYQDIPVTLTLNGNTLSGIWNGLTQLTSGSAYTISDDTTVYLLSTYLDDLPTGNTPLTFKFSGGADQTLAVTVSDTTPENDLNGFVKNITFKTSADNYVFFDQFNPKQANYEVEIPAPASSTFSAFYDVLVELDNPDNPDLDHIKTLNYSLSLESSNGTISRFRNPPSGGFFNSATLEVTDVIYGFISNGLAMTPYGIFDRLGIGDSSGIGDSYDFEINVHKKGNPEAGDVYKFNITLVPTVTGLSASAGGKSLPITPAENQSGINARFVREYDTTIPAGIDEITLKGAMLAEKVVSDPVAGAKFIYNEKDETTSFTTSGVTIDLKECVEKDGIYTVPFSIVYDKGAIETQSDYTLYVTAGEAADWTITAHPQGGTYDKGDQAVLSVETDANEGDATYQWQYRSLNGNPTFNDIQNANQTSFTAPTKIGGRRYYRCVVTDKNTAAYLCSDIAEVVVNLGKVNAPIIMQQPGIYNIGSNGSQLTPYKTEYLPGEPIDPIEIALGTTEGANGNNTLAEVVCEWYYNTSASTEGAVLLDRNNYRSTKRYNVSNYDSVGNQIFGRVEGYSPENLEVGEYYFYCVVTAVSNADKTNTTSVTSHFAKITVKERTGLDGFEGKGAEDAPYLIKSVEHLKKIDEYVLSGDFLAGAVFKFDNDITLPSDYEPIGKNPKSDRGISLQPFSGIIDGGGYTLTVAKGGRPLLEYTRDAIVRNLNIYGEEINGAGLLDKVIVDYGLDGVYQQLTDPDVITMENVTLLSGSKTLGSGLANGGYNSGINDIIVKNCIIQENVTVGYNRDQSDIGSFVGTLNGRIENSVSYASVYGIDSVGGLAGKKGQSMGDCEIVNSAFLGTIEATGGNVGGILGAGYISDSAPNTPLVTVRNCYVVADITGNSAPHISVDGFDMGSGIGGIAGSEIGIRGAWNNTYISDNHFYGTITDTNPDAGTKYGRVGGILGEIGSYSPKLQNYENNYYLKKNNYEGLGYQLQPDKDWEPNKNSFIAKSSEEFADGTVFDLLMEGKYSFKNWMQEENAPYPVHNPSAKPRVYALEISGDYKIIYYVGEELDTAGMKLTALYTITGDEVEVALKDAAFSGYNPNIADNQDVTVTYEGVSATFTVSVIRKYDNGGDSNNDTISVKFALIGSTMSDGDIDLGNKGLLYRGASYETWIELTEYKMAKGATVLELFDRALKQAHIPYTIRSMNNYVDSIGGLAEFTNGPRSGWMYTVGKKDDGSDGSHPNLGLREYVLNDGEIIIWHYVNDYSYEVHDWFDEPDYPALGDGTYYSLWLKALTSGSYTPPSGPGVATDSGTVLNPKVMAQNGAALVTVTASDMSGAIADAKKAGSAAIIIAPEITGTAKKVSVDIPKSSLASVASETDADLTVQTPVGSVMIPNNVLNSITTQASGVTVTVSVASVKADTLSTEQKKAVGDDPVYDVSITSGGKNISSFGGKSITISLPYTLKEGQDPKNVTVWYLDDEGKLEKISCTYDKNTGLATFTTTHLSKYLVGYSADWKNPFTDVKSDDWFYDAVAFAAKNGLFNGTTTTTFEPNTPMSRAMFATVLYRLEGLPAVTGTNRFNDVKNGEWYTDAVIWADVNGIIGGYDNGLFGTTDSVTREQVATILYRYAKYKGYDVTKTVDLKAYTDEESISGYAQTAMIWANAESLLTGRTKTTLVPAGSSSRAEVATILMRFVENVTK